MWYGSIFLTFAGMLILGDTNVYAYADPGSGTLILQILLAASIGVMFYIRRIIGWVRGLKHSNKSALTAETASAETGSEADTVEEQAP